MKDTRRAFLQKNLMAGMAIPFLPHAIPNDLKREKDFAKKDFSLSPHDANVFPFNSDSLFLPPSALDLSPANWIWMNAGRTLPNTILLFRRQFSLNATPRQANGYIMADSRYRLFVNGERVQFGPAPQDPRYGEVDPLELGAYLKEGENVIGVEVLYYGFGDGTWPIGKPGFIFQLQIDDEMLVSDEEWQLKVADAWPPGQAKRWYLRAFQEIFDARKYPYAWLETDYEAKDWWRASIISASAPDKPVISSNSQDYLYNSGGNIAGTFLIGRTIPMMQEEKVPIFRLAEQFVLNWKVAAEDFFRFDLTESDCFTFEAREVANERNEFVWEVEGEREQDQSIALTFEWQEQQVGFPYFSIEASEGTVVEILVHEAHQVGGTHRLLNTHFHAWSRFICKEGVNTFEAFDYESVRWIQFHIRQAEGKIRLYDIGLRRRFHPFPAEPQIETDDPKLNKLFSACINTMYNQSQETIVDGMGRERQQYSGDIGHVLHPLMAGFKGYALVERYCRTYSQGMTKAGYFLDCWPAYDRLARIMERELDMTPWGPLLDHGVAFNFDCYHYYLYSGDLAGLEAIYPQLKIFYAYLMGLKANDGLVPVEDLGVPVVWMDTEAYREQREKKCAFNLYIGAMLQYALHPLAVAFEEPEFAGQVKQAGEQMVQRLNQTFWSEEEQLYVINLPWLEESGEHHFCDRSLSMAILFDLFPAEEGKGRAIQKLISVEERNVGKSYPPNAIWRHWALMSEGYMEEVLKEFRETWYEMPSVLLNNTMGETFSITPDSSSQWSHASVSPLICAYLGMMGVRPLAPGCKEVSIYPQLGDLAYLKGTYETPAGSIIFDLVQKNGLIKGTMDIPAGVQATLYANDREWQASGERITM